MLHKLIKLEFKILSQVTALVFALCGRNVLLLVKDEWPNLGFFQL